MKDRIKRLSEVFKAFGDQKRLKIIKLLASSLQETFCVSDVAAKLKITQPAASQHIKVLKNIGLLEENRKGFRVYYSINKELLFELKNDFDNFFEKAFDKCPHDLCCEKCDFNCKG